MGVNGIYGLSGSGIDVESMVKVGMLTKQKQYDKMQQTYTKNEWTKQAYNEVYNNLTTFSTSTLSPYKMSSTMSAKTAVSSDKDAVTATANGNAVVMNHKVEVSQLSTSAYLVATESLNIINSDPSDSANSVQLQDYLFKKSTYNAISNELVVQDANGNAITDADGEAVNINAVAFSFSVSDGTMEDVKDASGKTVYEDGVAKQQLKQWTLKYTYGDLLGLTQKANGSFKDTENAKTFNDLVSDFNSLGTSIKMSYDAVSNKFSFYNKSGGEDSLIQFELSSDETVGATTKTFFQGMKLAQSEGGTLLGSGRAALDEDAGNYVGSVNDNVKLATITSAEALTDAENKVATTDTTLFDAVGIFDDDISFSINGTQISALAYDAADALFQIKNGDEIVKADTDESKVVTIGDLVDAINAESDTTNVKASFADGKLTLDSTVKGGEIDITVANTASENFLDKFFTRTDTDADEASATEDEHEISYLNVKGEEGAMTFGVHGQYGKAKIDGVEYNDLKDNSVTAYGIIYKFHNTTGVDESGNTKSVGVNIEQDIDAIVDKVKSFVEDYNKMLGGIYDKYNEKQYKDYAPLTASQRESMKDEQIEKWEEKAKSGLLYHDQTLNKIVTKMREAISNPIEGITGKYNSAYSLGISTTGIYGQLTLDEDKLRAALNDDSDAAYNVFSTLSKDDDFDQNGIAQRLGDVAIDATKMIKNRAGTDDSVNDDSDLGSLMRDLQNKMSDFKKLLDAFEDRLYKKYDGMEVALSTLGMQLSFITGGQ